MFNFPGGLVWLGSFENRNVYFCSGDVKQGRRGNYGAERLVERWWCYKYLHTRQQQWVYDDFLCFGGTGAVLILIHFYRLLKELRKTYDSFNVVFCFLLPIQVCVGAAKFIIMHLKISQIDLSQLLHNHQIVMIWVSHNHCALSVANRNCHLNIEIHLIMRFFYCRVLGECSRWTGIINFLLFYNEIILIVHH